MNTDGTYHFSGVNPGPAPKSRRPIRKGKWIFRCIGHTMGQTDRGDGV